MHADVKKIDIRVLERFFVNKYVEEMLSVEERLSYYWLDHLYSKSIKMHKQGQEKIAESYWQSAKKQFEVIKENTALKALVSSTALPKESYFLFKKRKYDEARVLIDENIALSIKLIEQGKYFLLVAILQQRLNLTRMYLFQKKFEVAVNIAKESIIYLMTGKSNDGNLKENYLLLLENDLGKFHDMFILQYINQVFLEVIEALFSIYGNKERFHIIFTSFYRDVFYNVSSRNNVVSVNKSRFEFIKLFSLILTCESSFVNSSLLYINGNCNLTDAQRKTLTNIIIIVMQLYPSSSYNKNYKA